MVVTHEKGRRGDVTQGKERRPDIYTHNTAFFHQVKNKKNNR
jgi:hypothetical protein